MVRYEVNAVMTLPGVALVFLVTSDAPHRFLNAFAVTLRHEPCFACATKSGPPLFLTMQFSLGVSNLLLPLEGLGDGV